MARGKSAGHETQGALAITQRAVDDLIPYARNARTHSEAQVALIAGSIREFGFNNPVLVDGANGIIAGHGRVLAARKLGLERVPVIELGHLSEAQRRAYLLADNRLAEAAGWDQALLALELGDLGDLGIDLGDLGFEPAELDALFAHAEADPREEATPEPPADPVSRPGDLWRLGPHRLICGDATDAAVVARLLDGVAPHLMVTDPPYGVWSNAPVIFGAHDTGPLIRSKNGFWLAIPVPAAGKSLRDGKITSGEWERRRGLRLRFLYRRTGPSLLVAEGRLNTKGQAVVSRSKSGRVRCRIDGCKA